MSSTSIKPSISLDSDTPEVSVTQKNNAEPLNNTPQVKQEKVAKESEENTDSQEKKRTSMLRKAAEGVVEKSKDWNQQGVGPQKAPLQRTIGNLFQALLDVCVSAVSWIINQISALVKPKIEAIDNKIDQDNAKSTANAKELSNKPTSVSRSTNVGDESSVTQTKIAVDPATVALMKSAANASQSESNVAKPKDLLKTTTTTNQTRRFSVG